MEGAGVMHIVYHSARCFVDLNVLRRPEWERTETENAVVRLSFVCFCKFRYELCVKTQEKYVFIQKILNSCKVVELDFVSVGVG